MSYPAHVAVLNSECGAFVLINIIAPFPYFEMKAVERPIREDLIEPGKSAVHTVYA